MSEAGGLRVALEALADGWDVCDEHGNPLREGSLSEAADELRALLASRPVPEADPTAGERCACGHDVEDHGRSGCGYIVCDCPTTPDAGDAIKGDFDGAVGALAEILNIPAPGDPGTGDVEHRPGAVFDEGTDGEQWACACGWAGADFGAHVADLLADRKTEWRRGWNDGEAEGQRGIIRQIHEAVAHLNPPDTGMGVFDLVEWSLAKARAEAGEQMTEWGIRVDYPNAPHLDGFTSPVPSEAHADRNIAADRPGTRVTKVRRQVTPWEDA